MTKNKAFTLACRAGYSIAEVKRVWGHCDGDVQVLLIALEMTEVNDENKSNS